MAKAKLTPHEMRAVGVTAGVDPRTVRAYLRGDPQRSTGKARVEEALQKMGLDHLLKKNGGAPKRTRSQKQEAAVPALPANPPQGEPAPHGTDS